MHPLLHPLFVDYCTYFNGNQDYFECHEVLEEYWKDIAPGMKLHPLVGYVQLATGMYHWRRNNLKGATKMLEKAFNIFSFNRESELLEYINYEDLCNQCLKSISNINADLPFHPFLIQIINDELFALVNNQIHTLPYIPTEFLLNKHMLRDRTDILIAREEKLEKRRTPD